MGSSKRWQTNQSDSIEPIYSHQFRSLCWMRVSYRIGVNVYAARIQMKDKRKKFGFLFEAIRKMANFSHGIDGDNRWNCSCCRNLFRISSPYVGVSDITCARRQQQSHQVAQCIYRSWIARAQSVIASFQFSSSAELFHCSVEFIKFFFVVDDDVVDFASAN